MDHVIGRYYNLASVPTGLDWDLVRDQIVERLQADREQFEKILSLQKPLRARSDKLVSGFLHCRGKDWDPNHIWRMLYFATGRDLNLVLAHRLKREDTFAATETYLVLPYLKNRHTFALLEIHALRKKQVQTVLLNPSRHMFFGLHTCFPENHETQVFSTTQEASLMYSRAMQRGDFQIGFIHVRVNPNAEINVPLRSGIFIVTENTDFNTLANTRRAFETFEVVDRQDKFGRASKPTPWRDYAANSVSKALREDPETPEREYSVKTSGMIESLRSDSEAFPALLEQLETQNKPSVVSRIRRQASQRGV